MVRPADGDFQSDPELDQEYARIERETEAAIARLGEGKELGCLFGADSHDERHFGGA